MYMGKHKNNNDGMYYGNLPSNYLANLGKEIVKQRIEASKGPVKDENNKSK